MTDPTNLTGGIPIVITDDPKFKHEAWLVNAETGERTVVKFTPTGAAMKADPISLTQLREIAATGNDESNQWAYLPVTITARELWCLIDTAEAARELADAADYLAIYPEGAVGVDELNEALTAMNVVLARFTSE